MIDTSRRGFLGGLAATLLISAGGVKLAVPQTKPLLAANGWPICNGQAIAHADYADLFRCIGTAWGGDETIFNVPDFRGQRGLQIEQSDQVIYAICPTDAAHVAGPYAYVRVPTGTIMAMCLNPPTA
jgi:hypothetical protein